MCICIGYFTLYSIYLQAIVFLCDFMLPNSPPQPSYLSTRPPPPGYRTGLTDDEDKVNVLFMVLINIYLFKRLLL